MCLNPTRGCASLQVSPPESKYPRNGCEQRWDFPSSSPGGPHPTAGSPLQDRIQTAPRRERGGGGGADTCPGRGCCPRPRGATRRRRAGRGTVDSSALTVLVLVEDGRPVGVAAPHVSPRPAPHPPPPASRGARRQAPRRRGSCPPAADSPAPAPARPGRGSLRRASSHPAT